MYNISQRFRQTADAHVPEPAIHERLSDGGHHHQRGGVLPVRLPGRALRQEARVHVRRQPGTPAH